MNNASFVIYISKVQDFQIFELSPMYLFQLNKGELFDKKSKVR